MSAAECSVTITDYFNFSIRILNTVCTEDGWSWERRQRETRAAEIKGLVHVTMEISAPRACHVFLCI